MKCPFCNHQSTRVIDSRAVENNSEIRRRRECQDCKKRFTTYEKCENHSIIVIKKNKEREKFDKNKILNGMIHACEKRKVPLEVLEKASEEIEFELNHLNQSEIETALIGEMVMERLKNIDQVAYVRFASVYREFKDIDSYLLEIEKIKGKTEE
ncbi:MAG: transcriptional repressor NrdR [Gallicola sp.]|uniref:transcriptional regulator NrdR n=1 Tax=Gallicola sp. Sow4_E12 TaxID=3438785 RepID=UPI0017A869FF|nr:transcriptional repressor NrdR [Gallicola sp.]